MASFSPSASSPLASQSMIWNSVLNIRRSRDNWNWLEQEYIYISKMCQALDGMNINSEPNQGKAVRHVADTILAEIANGRTRWSRAILIRQRIAITAPLTRTRSRARVYCVKRKKTKAMQRKVRFLGRLIPGCRSQLLAVVLKEAVDYIAALEMQVRALEALISLLCNPSPAEAAASTSAATTSY